MVATQPQPQQKPQEPQAKPPSKPKSGGKKQQNPHKVDTIPGFIILIGFGFFLAVIAAMNAEPYGRFVYERIQGLWLIGWLLSILPGSQLFAHLIGLCGFIGIQMGEVWPLMRKGSPAETEHPKWHLAMMGTCIIALICYVIDIVACLTFWPPLKVSLEAFRFAGLWSQIAWGNIIVILLTLFGLSLYVVLWRFVRRIA